MDGCFKTKLKDRGIMDPDMGTGLAYMVNSTDYAAHLEETAGSTADKAVIHIHLTSFFITRLTPLEGHDLRLRPSRRKPSLHTKF